jgi:hypothetical protein
VQLASAREYSLPLNSTFAVVAAAASAGRPCLPWTWLWTASSLRLFFDSFFLFFFFFP